MSIELRRPNLNIQTQFDLVLPSNRRRATPQHPTERQQRDQQSADRELPTDEASQANTSREETLSQVLESTVRGRGRRQLRDLPPRNYTE